MRIELDDNRVKVTGDEPSPEDYCLTLDTMTDNKKNDPDVWPVWYAELSDYRASALHAVETLDARYRAWRGRLEETIAARQSKSSAAHAIKREVESTTKFHTFKVAIADAQRLAHRYDGWMKAIEQRIKLRIAFDD